MYGALRCEYYIASEVKSLGYQIEAQQEDELRLNSEEDLWTIRPILCLPSLQSLEKSYKTCRYIRWKWNCWNPSVCLPQSMSILCSRQKSRGSGGLKYHPCCVCPPGFWGTALHILEEEVPFYDFHKATSLPSSIPELHQLRGGGVFWHLHISNP